MKANLKHVGENIRAARKSKTLTIETLSELVGISESFLGTVERGESSISVETLIGICKALDVTADSIVMDSKGPLLTVSDQKDTLLALLRNASEEELDFLIDYIKLYRGRVTF
jgi:transcriptional regulator with XRE-family HTH domain